MADNTVQTGTDTIATDDLATLNGGASSGVKVQRVKVGYGDDGILRDVSTAFPLPITSPEVTNQSQNLVMTALNNSVVVTGTGSGLVGVQITGTWTGTVAFEATTDSTTWFAVNGVASVSGAQVPTATANGQWRINSGGYASVRVRSSVVGTGTAVVTLIADPSSTMVTLAEPVQFSNGNATGTITANGGAVTMTVPDGHSSWFGYVAGTFSAGTTLAWQGSYDGVNWIATNGRQSTSAATNDLMNTYAADFTGPGPYFSRGNVSAFRFFRVVATSFQTGDNVSISITTSAATGSVFFGNTMDVRLAPELRTTGTASMNVNTAYLPITTASAATNVSFIASPGAGLSIYVTDMEASNGGTAGTLLSYFAGAAGATTGTATYARYMAPGGGGFVTNLKTPWKLPAATALCYRNSVAATIYATINYYIAP